MKQALVLGIVVVILIIAYLKFKDRVNIGEITGNAPAPATPSPTSPNTPPPLTPKADDKLALMDTATLAKFNTLSADQLSDPSKTDVVVEVGEGDAPVPSLRLADDVVLDGSSLQAGSDKRSLLVHLRGAGSGPVQAATEPAAASLDEKLRKQTWRAPLPVPAVPPSSEIAPTTWLWATEFRERLDSLRGNARVEGTFDSYQRGAANAKHEWVTIKELPGLKFYFPKSSDQSRTAADAEAKRKRGLAITLKLSVDLQDSPKYLSTSMAWNLPVLEQFKFWDDFDKGRGLRFTLGLATWARVHGLNDPADVTLARSRNKVMRGDLKDLAKPSRIVRVHLLDEIQEHWVFRTIGGVLDGPATVNWEGRLLVEDFFAEPRNICVVLKTGAKGESKGDVYAIQL